jgi:hypothetical protein
MYERGLGESMKTAGIHRPFSLGVGIIAGVMIFMTFHYWWMRSWILCMFEKDE